MTESLKGERQNCTFCGVDLRSFASLHSLQALFA